MSKTKNINILKDKTTSFVYCGRGRGPRNDPRNCQIREYGWLGNPVVKGKPCPICFKIHSDNGSTLPCYRSYLKDRLNKDEDFALAFYEDCLGQTLGCFCKPQACHTDVMIEILDKPLSLSKDQINEILNEPINIWDDEK